MAFGIIRARNINAGGIASTDKHNARRYDKKEDYPENINPEIEMGLREYYIKPPKYGPHPFHKEETNLDDVINLRLEENDVKGIKSNSNIAIEYVATINDKKAWDHYTPSGFFSNTKNWLEERHGRGSVVAVYEHYDESNPHCHIIIVPVKKKRIKWKNAKGSGERTETHLCTRDFTGGRDKLRALQNDFFTHLKSHYGNKLGVPIYRGTLVEDQTRTYIQQTIIEVANLKEDLKDIKTKIERNEVKRLILQKEEQLTLNQISLKEIEKNKGKFKKNWDKKGTRDNPIKSIFHSSKETKKNRVSKDKPAKKKGGNKL